VFLILELDLLTIFPPPTEAELLAKMGTIGDASLIKKSHKFVSSFLFRQFNDLRDEIGILELFVEAKVVLRPLLCMGIL